jgi:tetratricopeptide (TPR) repeat protein
MRRSLALLVAMSALIAGLYGVRAVLSAPPPPAPGIDPVELERRIEFFADRDPDPLNLSILGQLYLHRARSGYRVDDYVNARHALTRAAEVWADPATLTALANSHLALHEFAEASTAAESALAVERAEGALAALADAELALGDYSAADDLLNDLARRIPADPAYLVRRAQLSFLTGDVETAADLASRAAETSVSIGQTLTDQVLYLMSAGHFEFARGALRGAEGHLRHALDLDDRHPGALLELGRVQAARGDLEGAVRLVERSVALVPEPTSLAFLGDLYLAQGERELAEMQYATIDAIRAVDSTAYRLPVAMAYASRGINTGTAVSLAAAELENRTDPVTWHVYALALYGDGRVDEAYAALHKALGPADASLLYHAGVIAAANGAIDEAIGYLETALRLNPEFHPIDADDARRLLEELGG